MKLPRDLSGERLAQLLPRHLSVGTLSAIMSAVAEATDESKRDVRKRLFGG